MPTIIVGGAKTEATWAEYFCSILPKGTAVEFWDNRPFGLCGDTISHGTGVFLYSFWYDGVIAEIDCCGKRKALFLALDKKVRIRRLRDMSRLVGQGVGGEGI